MSRIWPFPKEGKYPKLIASDALVNCSKFPVVSVGAHPTPQDQSSRARNARGVLEVTVCEPTREIESLKVNGFSPELIFRWAGSVMVTLCSLSVTFSLLSLLVPMFLTNAIAIFATTMVLYVLFLRRVIRQFGAVTRFIKRSVATLEEVSGEKHGEEVS